jgi:hypothetical protein
VQTESYTVRPSALVSDKTRPAEGRANLSARDANPQGKDKYGMTPSALAAHQDQLDTLKYLAVHGAMRSLRANLE